VQRVSFFIYRVIYHNYYINLVSLKIDIVSKSLAIILSFSDSEETSSPFLNTEESVGRNNVSTIIDDTLTTIAKYTSEDDTSILPPTKLSEEKCYEKTCTSSKNLGKC